MPARLIQLLLLIALLFAPICMMGGGAAMAMQGSPSSGEHQVITPDAEHCADMGGPGNDEQDGSAELDCRMTCSGVLAQSPVLRGALAVASVPLNMALAHAEPGLNLAADPPPPRLS